MPSPDNGIRAWLERGLHALALLLLSACLLSAWRQRSQGGSEEIARSPGLGTALARWSTVAAPVAIEARLDHPPTTLERDWLAALPGAGTRVTWSGRGLIATAMQLLPSVDPGAGATLLVAAPEGSTVALGSARIDSARVEHGMLRWQIPGTPRRQALSVGGVAAEPVLRDSLVTKRLLILGRASWEAKFTVAALEERGWIVDAHLALAPGGDIAQGVAAKAGGSLSAQAPPVETAPSPVSAPGRGVVRTFQDRQAQIVSTSETVRTPQLSSIAIDTARYAVVLALDSAAAREAPRIARFVRNGGGLVLWPDAAAAPSLALLAPALTSAPSVVEARHAAGALTLDSVPLRALGTLRTDAVVLARRGSDVALAARRVGQGRVIQLGLEELWRWRMGGGDGAPVAHRVWLSGVVAAVAFAPRHPLAVNAGEAAPLASLIDKLGAPTTGSLQLSTAVSGALNAWTFALLCGALLCQWLSRRLRSRP